MRMRGEKMETRTISSQWYAFATVVLWSSAFVFTKVALLSFSSAALGFLRCAIASVVLYAVLRCRGVRMLGWRELPRFALSGALGFSIYLFIFNKGSETLTAATGCILIATAPIITALMASFVFRERLTRLAWAALWLAFIGVLILMLWNGSVSINAGVFWMLGASLAISAYNVIQRLYAHGYTSLQITAYSFFTATAMLAGFLPESIRQLGAAPIPHVIAVAFLGVFPSALAYLLWAKALSFAATTSDVTKFMFLTPLLSLVLGYVVISELPGVETWLGGAIILSGLALFHISGKRAERARWAAARY